MKIFLAGRIPFLLIFFMIMFFLAAPLAAETHQWREPLTGMEFVWVPAGSFFMGQTDAEKESLVKVMGRDRYSRYCADEVPRHEVTVGGFWIGKYEVTNAQYLRFALGHDSKSYKQFSLNGPRQPVVEVSWNEAVAFAEWLSKKSGRIIRLPREFEWEYACRAGTTSIRYWGEDVGDACLYANVADLTAKHEWPVWNVHNCDDSFAVTSPVGSFKPNGFLLYDMLGNVWEWCNDRYPSHGKVNPAAVAENKPGCSLDCRVARGSCWDNPARYVRSASRNKRRSDYHGYNIGFRLLLVADSQYSGKQ